MKQVEELLNRYFEGETSVEEERWLKEYFRTTSILPPELEMYRSLFGYFEGERSITSSRNQQIQFFTDRRKIFWGLVTAAAACVLFLLLPQLEDSSLPSTESAPVVEIVKQKEKPTPEVHSGSMEVKADRSANPTPQSRLEKDGDKNVVKPHRKRNGRKRDAFEPMNEVKGVEKSLKKLDVIKEMNRSLAPLSSLAYLQDYFPKDRNNN